MSLHGTLTRYTDATAISAFEAQTVAYRYVTSVAEQQACWLLFDLLLLLFVHRSVRPWLTLTVGMAIRRDETAQVLQTIDDVHM
jgi:hypothetical protein